MNRRISDGATPKLIAVADAPRPATRNSRVVLISHASHLDRLAAADVADSVLVCSDWLTWQRLARDGRPCVLLEEALSRWRVDKSWEEEFMLRVTDPVYVDGRDITLFRGVSLGRVFLTPAILLRTAALRIEYALREIIREFRPREIVYVDCRAETLGLPPDQRFTIAAAVAGENGIAIVDRRPAAPVAGDELPMVEEASLQRPARSGTAWLRHTAATCAELLLDWASAALATLGPGRREVLIMLNTSMTVPLLRDRRRGASAIRPLVFFRQQRKALRFLARCLANGTHFLARPRRRPLSPPDKAEVKAIYDRLLDNLARLGGPANAIIAAAVRELFDNGVRIFRLAEEIVSAERFLARRRPARVVVDTPKNAPHILYAELARKMGIAVDYIWHSAMMPETFRISFLGGDSRTPAVASRMLSWGHANDRWAAIVAPAIPRVFVGCPIAGTYRDFPKTARTHAPRGGKRVLVLEYSIVSRWLTSLNATKYEYFVNTVRTLRALGYRDIAYKLHPGRPNKAYYERIRGDFGLACRVLKSEPLPGLLKDFDIVIGPIHTGAIFESLAAGKEVYAFWCGPDEVVRTFYDSYGLLRDVAELPAALAERRCLDNAYVLEDVYGGGDAAAMRRRFWAAMDDAPDVVHGPGSIAVAVPGAAAAKGPKQPPHMRNPGGNLSVRS